MFNRINVVGNSNAFYFEPNFGLNNFLQGMVVEYFDVKNASWNPIKFSLEQNVSHAFGIYTFNSPSGSNVMLRVQGNDFYIVASSILGFLR